jgi:hypothetical protein
MISAISLNTDARRKPKIAVLAIIRVHYRTSAIAQKELEQAYAP